MSNDPLRWADFWRYLELETDLRRPTRFDVALVEAIMIWPDDEVWRAKAATAAFVEFIGGGLDKAPKSRLALHRRLTRDALPIRAIHAEVSKERFMRGIIAGDFLHRMVASGNLPPAERRTAAQVVEDCIAPVRRTKDRLPAGYKLSLKTWNNEIWPAFRSVSHLWAAHIEISLKNPGSPFPCRAVQLEEFLAFGEFFRRQGESIKPYKRGDQILRHGEAFPLPLNLQIAQRA